VFGYWHLSLLEIFTLGESLTSGSKALKLSGALISDREEFLMVLLMSFLQLTMFPLLIVKQVG
jgi:hypothetical protein